MTIPAAEVCAAAGRNSETMRRDVDEEVLVPLLRATAKEVMGEFKACLKDALVGGTIGSIVCVDGGPEKAVEILKGYPDWECWYTIAPVKGASRIKEKVGEYAKSHWPGVEQLGDCLRAMVVCRRGKKSGDLIYRTWKQLEQAFDIRKGHGRLKNNYATAGMPNDDPKVFAKNQKPPDMLMNAVLDVEGCMSMPAEIQVHHEEILDLKESKVHLLYEIARAKSIGILRGGAPAPAKAKPASRVVPQQSMVSGDQVQLTAQLEEMKKLLDAKDSAIEELKLQLHESSVEEPASLHPPVAAMVDSFMSSMSSSVEDLTSRFVCSEAGSNQEAASASEE